jgi:hypothetical protein
MVQFECTLQICDNARLSWRALVKNMRYLVGSDKDSTKENNSD